MWSVLLDVTSLFKLTPLRLLSFLVLYVVANVEEDSPKLVHVSTRIRDIPRSQLPNTLEQHEQFIFCAK
jgi:hypothetical protein